MNANIIVQYQSPLVRFWLIELIIYRTLNEISIVHDNGKRNTFPKHIYNQMNQMITTTIIQTNETKLVFNFYYIIT